MENKRQSSKRSNNDELLACDEAIPSNRRKKNNDLYGDDEATDSDVFFMHTDEQIRKMVLRNQPRDLKNHFAACYHKIESQNISIESLNHQITSMSAVIAAQKETIRTYIEADAAHNKKAYFKSSPLGPKQLRQRSSCVVRSISNECAHQSGENPARKQQIIEAVVGKLTVNQDCKDEDVHTESCVKIVHNIFSMMDELNGTANSSSVAIGHVKQIVATAVCGDNISREAVSRATKISKRQLRFGAQQREEFRQVKAELDAKLCDKECQETKDDDSGAGTDDHTSDSSVSDSNSGSDSDTFSDDGEIVVVMLPDQPRNKGPQVRKKRSALRAHNKSYRKVFAHRHRKSRSDKRNYEMVNEFLHNNQNGARLDTDKNSKRILIRKTKKYENVRFLRHSVYETYLHFLQSDSFTSFQKQNTINRTKKVVNAETGKCEIRKYREVPDSMSFRSFVMAMCPCARLEGQRDCADEPSRAMAYALDAWKRMRMNVKIKAYRESCVYTDDVIKDKFDYAPNSLEHFTNLVCCDKENLQDLSIHCKSAQSREELEAANIQALAGQEENFDETLSSLYSREAAAKVLNSKDARDFKKVPQGNLNGQAFCRKKACSYQKCNDCGVRRNFCTPLIDGEFTADPELKIKVRVFNQVSRAGRQQREVEVVEMTCSELPENTR